MSKKKRSGRESVRSVREYLWWSLRWKRLEEEVCFKSRVKKRRSDWWWQTWRGQCGSDLCRIVRRWKTRMWMRLTERVREFIPKAGCRMLKRTVCNFERWWSRWSGYGDNRRGSSWLKWTDTFCATCLGNVSFVIFAQMLCVVCTNIITDRIVCVSTEAQQRPRSMLSQLSNLQRRTNLSK